MDDSGHIQFDKIADLVEGRLASGEEAEVLPHISGCGHCSSLRERLEHAVKMMRDDTSENAPPFTVANAVRLFRSRKGAAASAIRRLLASLSFDSLQLSPAFGMRAGESVERQIIFDAEENKVHLQVVLTGDVWNVSGQVLGPCTGGGVEVRGASSRERVALDESCEFTLPPLKDGDYALILRLQDVEIEIPGLKLGT